MICKLKDMKLATKQKLGHGVILLIMAGINIFSLSKLATMRDEIDEVTRNWLPRIIAISDLNLNTSYLRLNQLQHVFATDEAGKQEQEHNVVTLLDKISYNLDTYEQLKTESEKQNLYSENESEQYAAFDLKWEEYHDLSFVFFKLSRDNKNQEAIDLLNGEAYNVFNDFSANLDDLITVNKNDSYKAFDRAEATFRSTRFIIMILLLVAIIISAAGFSGFIRFITIPVQQLEKAAKAVADGDLTVKLKILSKDEIGNLASSFNKMTSSLREATNKMKRQAEKLRAQWQVLQVTNKELQQKSQHLEIQKAEIENKNVELEDAMHQLKKTQEQLLMKEKMAALGDLVAGVAHEINNPIGTVNSSIDVSGRCLDKIEIVLEKSKTLDEIRNSSQLPKFLNILKDNIRVTLIAGDRIATIVKSLKTFARLDQAEYQKVNIHEGIDSSLTLMGKELIGRITVKKEYGKIPDILCYPSQLNQVFFILLKNASQAIDKSGNIGIKTYTENNHVHIQISDDGKGIPENKLGRIFEFGFSTGDSRVKMSAGLSTAFNIIQKHNGEIRVKSEVGKGTKFSIVLPM